MTLCFTRLQTPTIFALSLISLASSYGQTVTLALGSGSGNPGSTLNLGVALSGGAAPAGLQWTLNYSSGDISSVAVTIGSSASASGKSVQCSGSTGSTTCVVYGLNNTGIADGPVATASIQIAST